MNNVYHEEIQLTSLSFCLSHSPNCLVDLKVVICRQGFDCLLQLRVLEDFIWNLIGYPPWASD